MSTQTKFILLLVASLGSAIAGADDVRPVQIQIREQEPGTFLVEWQVPQVIPRQAMPAPEFPESCRPEGDRTIRFEEGNWLNRQRYRCPDGIAGRTLRVNFPFGNPSLSTIFRAELLSGERYAHMLAPGEELWEVPAGASPDAPLRAARRGVANGISHALGHWAHFAFVGVVALLGSAKLVGRFSAGQLAGICLGALAGIRVDPALGELGLALAVMLLAREALRPEAERREIAGLALAGGAVHGFGLAALGAAAEIGLVQTALMALGMDVTLLVLTAAALLLARRLPFQRAAAYGLGAIAVAIGLFVMISGQESSADVRSSASRLPGLSNAAAVPASSRIAPQAPDAPVQSFLAIEAFEARHEVLFRVADIASAIGLDPAGAIAVEEQARVKDQVKALALSSSTIAIDGELRQPQEARIDFMTVDAQGALPRQTPVRETVAEAFLGFTVSHLTKTTPQQVVLTWTSFLDEAPAIPSTMIDPETTSAAVLTLEAPSMTWENALAEDPVPTVEAVAVEPTIVPIPTLSLPLLLAAVFFGFRAMRGTRTALSSGVARLTLALAMLLAPVGNVAVALPTASADSPEAARRILAGILPNVYRAFEFRDESQAYDRLELSVTGETLTEIYLEHQRALEMEERGGARARVEAVEVGDVASVEPRADGGFDARATWQVGGTVTHFGHRHFRQNRYDALVTVVPVEERWKIRSIEVLDEERVR